MRTAIALALLLFAAACGTTKSVDKRKAPPPPPESVGGGELAKGSGEISDEVRRAVSEQLDGCPPEKINIICVERDRSGECIAVRGLGCDKEIEYKFGND
jgi:hypothetical protein